jgi:hypothetical protein
MLGKFEMITLVFSEMSREGRNYLDMAMGHSSNVSIRLKNVQGALLNGFCTRWILVCFDLPFLRSTLRLNVILWAPVQFRQ